MNVEKEIFDIALKDIMPNRFQPREIFDDNALNELSQSIKEHGVIQPIIVRKVGDKFEIIAGERRFRASQLAGKETIPALIKNIDDKETAKIALLENLQRQNLTPIEEAKTYQTILKLENITQDELATSLGKSQPSIANKLRLLNLDETVQTALLNSKISERHARSLLNIEDKIKQRELLNRIVLERMTVKQLDDEISRMLGRKVETTEDIQLNEVLQKETPSLVNTNEVLQSLNDTSVPVFGLPPISQPIIENSQIKQEEIPINSVPAMVPPVIKEQIDISQPEPEVNFQSGSNIFEQFRKKDSSNDAINNSISVENKIYDLKAAIADVHNSVNSIKEHGFSVECEEFDFENIYQVVIKIDKNK